jgi:glutathione peroxidase
MPLDDIPLTIIDGRSTSFGEFAGGAVLVVDVASRCGFTPQYEQLEALQRRYADRAFTVLAFPSDQFRQELDSDEAVADYCSATWGVTLPMSARVELNGPARHPLFAELTRAADLDGEAGDVRWNFEKFLVTRSGEVVRFRSAVRPDDPDITGRIEAALERDAA